MADFIVQKVKLPAPETYGPYVYSGFKPGTTVLKAGHVKESGRRPFGRDTAYDRDAPVPMRDGVKLYTDIFRPADSETNKVPAVLLWGPYGKTGNGTSNVHPYCRFEVQEPYNDTHLVLQGSCTTRIWGHIIVVFHGNEYLVIISLKALTQQNGRSVAMPQ